MRNYRRDGSPFWNQFYLAPVFDSEGLVEYYIGIQVCISAIEQEVEGLGHSSILIKPNLMVIKLQLIHSSAGRILEINVFSK